MALPLGQGDAGPWLRCPSQEGPRYPLGERRQLSIPALHPRRSGCQPQALASRRDLANVEQGISSRAVVKMLRGLRLPVTKLIWVLSA